MRVDVTSSAGHFRYRVSPDPGDPATLDLATALSGAKKPLTMVEREFEMGLPPAFTALHPDLHAMALLRILRPFVASELALSFGVSAPFADAIAERYGITLPAVDRTLAPRRAPGTARPCLLFSGGMDSAAASVVMPPDTVHLFLDRIPYPEANPYPLGIVEMVHARALCELLRKNGREVLMLRDGHEHLFRPYPVWHTEMKVLPAYYLADSLGVSTFVTGDVLCAIRFGGYQAQEPTRWAFRAPERGRGSAGEEPEGGDDQALTRSLLGLDLGDGISGLSEVATAIVVSKSPYKDRTASCYYVSKTPYCMRCDKCFKKILLMHIAEGREVPAELVDHFLGFEHLAAIFRRRYFDWHHVWYYIFQKIRCSHWFVQELQRQARSGPDLGVLEKWYPGSRGRAREPYRDVVEANIARLVGVMTDDEVQYLERLEVPPLHAPELPARSRAFASSSSGPAPGHSPQISRLHRRLVELLLPCDGRPATFSGLRVVALEVTLDGEAVSIRLASSTDVAEPAGELDLEIAPLGPAPRECFKRVGSLAVSYCTRTPLDSTLRRLAMTSFLQFLASSRRPPVPRSGSGPG